MIDDICSPLYDFVFSFVFGNQKNINNTKGFLKALLGIPDGDFSRLTVVNPSLKRYFKDGKEGTVDLMLTTKSGRVMHIELQVEKTANMRNRMMYYASRMVSDQLVIGEDYNKLKQVIGILICDHVLLDEEKYYINEYEMRNVRNNSFTNLMKLYILELPKLPENEDSAVWPWLKFFKCKTMEEFKMLAKKHPELKKAVDNVVKISFGQRWRFALLQMHMHATAKRARKRQIQMDLEESRVKGREEGKVETARNLKSLGISTEIIAQSTGLSVDTVANL